MPADRFELATHWHFDAPIEVVWSAISRPEEWPTWWRAVERVDSLEQGNADGVGARRRMTWRTALPYRLNFEMRTVRVVKFQCIEGESIGQLAGRGLWQFQRQGHGTSIRYDWHVAVIKPWMRILSPVLRPAFAWNHGVVMSWGETGLRRHLGAFQKAL